MLYSIILIQKERHYMLPSLPTRGHGIVLLIFWTLVFINENITIMNLKREHWWFNIVTIRDKTEITLFVMRYISCLLIFVLGLKAPGLTLQNDEDYMHLENDTNNVSIRCELF